ncbi:MAG: 30S ribosomal protein S13 [Candidatus Doudnabacteria bacterium RIFCSPHIGHO2_01_FULL_43_23]|uniref:Small ribosomal subunit protein uS13 n=1 Tax=Candidatus Doudnabacteria bacterium RIFCSPHIGHO2_01_FULL_43_23 TaxID=1817822 RepID=A0A1F5NUC3_9BACT|nr:MAG: 30S ribosomal protein S13 [Candidatus Doudnabacteria bacterium RIFCSPHIGHO2_01_FULL_43_23]
MARIGGVNLPPNKRIEASLQYVFGVGATVAKKALSATGISPDIRTKDLSAGDEDKLRTFIEKNFVLEGQLRQQRNLNIKLLKEIGSYRGMRHSRGLPSRGQRTKTNSRTRRGNVRRTVGSGRKPTDQKT